MTKNSGAKPRIGQVGQAQGGNMGKGGNNKPAAPFGSKPGTNNHPKHASPRFGGSGQRLASNETTKGATGYPPPYRGAC